MNRAGTSTPASFQNLLDPAGGRIEPPVRSVLFGLARFEQHGRSLAQTHEVVSGKRAGAGVFFPRLKDNIRALRLACALLDRQARDGQHLGPAAHWLLDNTGLLADQAHAIAEGLPRSFFRLLPRLRNEPLAGLPRIYGVAWAWVAHTDSAFDAELLEAYLQAYRQVRELSLAELWALPTTLRVVLVENLRRLAERAATQQAAREAAHHWFDQPDDQRKLQALAGLYERAKARGVQETLALVLEQRQSELPQEQAEALRRWLRPLLQDSADALVRQQNEATEDQQSVRNAISTLRQLDRMDWRSLFERISSVLKILQRSPVHAAEREDSQDITTRAIERLARQADRPEVEVARNVLTLTQRAMAATDASAAPAYWCAGPGENELRASLGLPRRWAPRPGSAAFRRPATAVYFSLLTLLPLGLVWWLLAHQADATAPPWLLALAGLLLLGPLGEAVVAMVNRLISESARPTQLPRLAFAQGITLQHRVLVVMPCMLSHPAAIHVLAAQLEQHYLANREAAAQFALLSDWVDAPQPGLDADAALLQTAAAALECLNERHPSKSVAGEQPQQRFLLLHRERTWSATEAAYIGWERKRGKLEWLVRALAEPGFKPFIDLGMLSQAAADTRYIVTLDSDTDMPPGRLRALVGVAAHPMNQPRLAADAQGRLRVVAGYGILQPRVVTPLPAPHTVTRFHRLFSGQCGVDPYSAASSEIYQDLFGEGTYTGKGVLNVAACHAMLVGRLPAGQVLSHDLLEGALVRCAGVSDITLVEEAPVHADVAASRLHRWTRGDWQLLPFLAPLFSRWRTGTRPYAMPWISRWKMLDNLRRSLVAPMALALVLLTLASSVLPLAWVLGIVAAAFSAGPLLGAVAGLVPSRGDIALARFYRLAGADLLRALLLPLWYGAQLLQLSLLYADAVARALFRQLVSRRHLLQWTTAEAAQAAARTDLAGLWRQHRQVPMAALGLGLLLWLVHTLTQTPAPSQGAHVQPLAAFLLLAVWAASPLWTWWVSRALAHTVSLRETDRRYLLELARDTWRYYETHVTADDNHLPPDNVQQMPHTLVAHRTSPTNIGLYLLSAACARELGFITAAELAQRLQLTLATLERLPRYRGHFYNWIDTQSLAVLAPAYVSTVDSGNCSAHLLAVAAACTAIATDVQGQQGAVDTDNTALQAELAALAARLRALALAPDFAMLYDPHRRLLTIGMRTESAELDDNHYDLLASESRLTSLLAIGKGDVPAEHWAALGRPFFAEGTEAGLKSWSGSMFEYLMPSLVLAEPMGSVLRQAARSAVQEQQREGREHATPWGISESAIAGQDHTLAYQYGPQGVPRLALRRTPPDERVVAPYATAMALVVDPAGALANLRALQDLGVRQAFGFIEALDYSPKRLRAGAAFVPVETFMAHHQGMSLLAYTHVLAEGAAQRWSAADPCLRCVLALLHERAPREVSTLRDPPLPPVLRRTRAALSVYDSLPLTEALSATQLLTSGPLRSYAVRLRSNGAGASVWNGIGLTRWRDDLLRDQCGTFFYVQPCVQPGINEPSYLRAPDQALRHSLTAHPAPDPAAQYHCRIHTDRVVFDTEFAGMTSKITVWVSPEDDCELRQLELTCTGTEAMVLELSAASEMTLAPQRADEAHPAFSNLFVQANWHSQTHALYLRRQPRLAGEQVVQAVFFLARHDADVDQIRVCTDRARWLGRYGTPAAPRGNSGSTALTATAGATSVQGQPMDTGLDPVAVIGCRVRLVPGVTVKLTYCLAAGLEAEALEALVDKYRQASHVARASSMSHTMASIRLREWQFDVDSWRALLHLDTLLSSHVTRDVRDKPGDKPGDNPGNKTSNTPGRSAPSVQKRCDRQLLWRHGISGDRPLLLVTITGEEGLALVQTLSMALRRWTAAGLAVDLVVCNGEPASYLLPVQRRLVQLKEQSLSHAQSHRHEHIPADRHATLHLLAESELSADERDTLQTLARLRIRADGRPLAQQMRRVLEDHQRDHATRTATLALPLHGVLPELRAQLDRRATPRLGAAPHAAQAPSGQFAPDNGDFSFALRTDQYPARPWTNVLANPDFGCLVTEVGGGNTWAGNSRMHQVTGWSNDALTDPAAEWLVLHDIDNKQAWCLGRWLGGTAHGAGAPVRSEVTGTANGPDAAGAEGSAGRTVLHGIGHTRMQQRVADIEVSLQWCVDAKLAVKQLHVSLRSDAARPRRLRLVAMAEWMMGSTRQERLSIHTQTEWVAVAPHGEGLPPAATALALLATQRDHLGGFGDSTALLAWRLPSTSETNADDENAQLDGWTCDRREFFGAAGQMVLPLHLSRRSGSGLDACAAIGLKLRLAPGASAEATLLLGHAAQPQAATALLAQAWPVEPRERLAQQRAQWPALLGGLQVKTPDAAFDALVNHWLPYQTLCCRIWARAAFYQAGGAFGFRDQLQDAMSLVGHAPQLLAEQLRIHAARQFTEGDVQHWWHAPGGAGVRTHFSDDRLWLPLGLALHHQRTGQVSLLEETVPFLQGAAVPEGAEDIYETPAVSDQSATLYEHGARAIDISLASGSHALPLFGTGDWNDGMNRVGHEGRGESVWMAWFACTVIDAYLPLAQARGDAARVQAWAAARSGWVQALDAAGWDGQWYRRGFFDDGSALGSAANAECRIDLIAQAWAVLSGAGDAARAAQAMGSAKAMLFDANAHLVKLLDPPLKDAQPSAGYIQAYAPGVRENGGQYNHAAVWALMALARQGDAAGAWQAFTAISPAHRWQNAALGAAYAIEPYAVAGDVYSQPPWVGRGGWSWYTGAAGWLLRAALESICGVVVADGRVTVKPCLPPHWPQATVNVSVQGLRFSVVVCADEATAVACMTAANEAANEGAAVDGAAGATDFSKRRRLAAGQALGLEGLVDGSVLVVC